MNILSEPDAELSQKLSRFMTCDSPSPFLAKGLRVTVLERGLR